MLNDGFLVLVLPDVLCENLFSFTVASALDCVAGGVEEVDVPINALQDELADWLDKEPI